MNIEDLLRDDEPAILDEAWRAIARLEHYQRDGERATRRRLEALHRLVIDAVHTCDLNELLAHAGRIAQERFEAGFALSELQTAFSMLEEAIWRHAVARLPPSELAWGLGLVGTALAHGKDALGRAFVSLAPRAHAPSIDLTALFKGTESANQSHCIDDFVYPV